MGPDRGNKGLVCLNTTNMKKCRTFHHNKHTPEGKVRVYYEKTPGKLDFDLTQGYLVHRSKLKWVGFID
jgi:hypothetical protein